jgi:type I restriction enzyme S subunit
MELIVSERIGNNVEVMQKIRLKDIVKISKGKKSIQVNSSNLRYIQIGDLRNDNNLKYAEHSKSNVLCTKNDVLIAWDGANAGTIGYNLEGAVGSTLAKLVINENYKIFPDFLGRFLQTKSKSLRDNCSGATIPHISKSELENLEIPLPSLPTQQKIAEILDTADQLCQYNKQLIEKYDALTQSLFLEMFGDPLRNEKGFLKSTVGEQCFVKGGKRVPKEDNLVKENTGYPYIKAGNIKKGKVTTKNLEYLLPETREKLKRYIVNEGDVCITVVGANIGDIGIVPNELHLANLTENANKLLIKDIDKLHGFYLATYLQMDFVQTSISAKTMAVGVPKLALFRIEQIELLLPPLSLQTQFAERIQMIETQKQQAQESLAKSEDLFQSLLQRAFKGELV